MKAIALILMTLISQNAFSQVDAEELAVEKTIQQFFEAFHQQDSVALGEIAHPSITMQSIAEGEEGNSSLSTEEYKNFVKAIVSIPEGTKFEEKLHSFEISVNGPLASAVTPYSFFVNDTLSHCGVNSFQLYKQEGKWKIIYIVDTRKKDGCKSHI